MSATKQCNNPHPTNNLTQPNIEMQSRSIVIVIVLSASVFRESSSLAIHMQGVVR